MDRFGWSPNLKKQGDALMQENEPDFEKHIDDIVKAIGDKLERNVIANELRRYR